MLGLIHKIFFGFIDSAAGPEAVAEVRRRAGVGQDKQFVMNEAYDDEEWRRVFASAVDVLGVPQPEAEARFADYFFADALKQWPEWFQMAAGARQLLERQPAIHNSLATATRDPQARKAIRDKFRVDSRGGDLITRYRSPNGLCGLYMAIVRRVLAHYGEDATIEEVQCLRQGAEECVFRIRWASQEQQQ